MLNGVISFISNLVSGNDDSKAEEIENFTTVKGTQGRLESEALVLKQGNNLVMVIDYDLGDMPSWVEWDVDTSSMYITQSGGMVAQMDAIIPSEEVGLLEMFKRLILVTKVGEERVSHMVPFLIRA